MAAEQGEGHPRLQAFGFAVLVVARVVGMAAALGGGPLTVSTFQDTCAPVTWARWLPFVGLVPAVAALALARWRPGISLVASLVALGVLLVTVPFLGSNCALGM